VKVNCKAFYYGKNQDKSEQSNDDVTKNNNQEQGNRCDKLISVQL